jgi:tetratricopeptide (TPR) repeat protein
VAFSPDGARLASAGEDGAVRVWDVATGQEALTLRGHAGPVRRVAFSPDGGRLASAGGDGTVKVWDSTPITPESRARDDALRLIRFLLDRVASEAELRHRIASDRTITEATRATALELAKGFWVTRIRGQAEILVSSLFDRLLLRAEVRASLGADPTLDPEVRAAALALAESWPESAVILNNAAWALVRLPSRAEADAQRGLRLAERACQIVPGDGVLLNTLGVAQYRTGQYEKARATLTRSNELNANREPPDLAFLAMTLHRLNQLELARATLMRIREIMKDATIADNKENQEFLREAESVILGAAELPEDVFAP